MGRRPGERTRRISGAPTAPNVRRAFCAAFAAVALGALLFAGGGWPLGHAGAATTSCVWVKHTKRVVTHPKRHGKRTRVVRIKHYRTCRKVTVPSEPTPSPTGPTTTVPAPTPTPTPTPTPPSEPPVIVPPSEPAPEPEANALGVAADDHGGLKSYVLSRQTVRSGRLTLQLNNKGEDPHDMDIERIGPGGGEGVVFAMPRTGPGSQSTESVELAAGTYRMFCDIGHHAEEGMEATITVE